jgi:tRNA (cytidine/uridine-2'-O-)-methyltransferase
MFHVVLYEPEIPPNTGNVIRLCANTGAELHLIEPLGFELDEARVRRAGLDYHELARVRRWPGLADCLAQIAAPRWFAVSTRGRRRYDSVAYETGDAFVFGPESRGLPAAVLECCPSDRVLRLPMVRGNRSLNLSNAVAVLVFEAWRQLDFADGEP